jgi:hypothetical protein
MLKRILLFLGTGLVILGGLVNSQFADIYIPRIFKAIPDLISAGLGSSIQDPGTYFIFYGAVVLILLCLISLSRLFPHCY